MTIKMRRGREIEAAVVAKGKGIGSKVVKVQEL
jgi:hypothetical protein